MISATAGHPAVSSKDLNVYFVKKFTLSGGNPGRVGEALTGDCFVGLDDATESGVIVSWSQRQDLNLRPADYESVFKSGFRSSLQEKRTSVTRVTWVRCINGCIKRIPENPP